MDPGSSGAPDVPAIGGPLPARRFRLGLSAVVGGALVLRVVYVLAVTRFESGPIYDAFWYGVTANELRSGMFFRTPFGTAPSAAHPPLTSLLLGSVNFLIGTHRGDTVQRLTMAVLGALVVLVVGLLGRAVAGPWTGLVAAGLAAVSPDFWMPSGIVMSETPAMLFMALLLLALVHFVRTPTLWRAALVGVLCGCEALVRAELILFVPCLLVPAVVAVRAVGPRRVVALLAVGLVGVGVVIGPWVGRNLVAFTDPTYLSTGDGLALLGANCPATYGGSGLGFWSLTCATSVGGAGDESVQSAREQHAAVVYAEDHLGRLPLVVAARVAREWSLYQPVQEARIEMNEGRPFWASVAGLVCFYLEVPLAVVGVVILRRRRIRQWYLLVPAGVVTFVSAVVYGMVRFRAPCEVGLVVLAAPALVLGFGGRTTRGVPTGAPGTPEAPDGPVAVTPASGTSG